MAPTIRNMAMAALAAGAMFIIGCTNTSNGGSSSGGGANAAPAAMSASKLKQYAPAAGFSGTKYLHDTRKSKATQQTRK